MRIKKTLCLIIFVSLFGSFAKAGLTVTKSNGITFTGADGITFTGADGITFTGADGLLSYQANGITFTGADGITFTGADSVLHTGTDGITFTGADGITFTGADGITFTGADGITFTGADGITFTGADGTQYHADAVKLIKPTGISMVNANGITFTGADGATQIGTDGITFTGADGITFTGADGITFTGADSLIGFRADGSSFTLTRPNGLSFANLDGITFTGADGITFTGADGITFTGADHDGVNTTTVGLQGIDPELAAKLSQATDDSNINAVLVFHHYPTAETLDRLREIGIVGGTLFKRLPMIVVSATRNQLAAVSRLPQIRSIYGNRTLTLNSDPYFKTTQIQKVVTDRDLQAKNGGLPVSGRGVAVAVLDTGINAAHNDLAGKVVQNVKLADTQSAPLGFINPLPIENLTNTDTVGGHGTFVAGIIAGSGVSSGGKYSGVAPGAKLVGLSAGDLSLLNVLSGFDYLLEKGAAYNVRAVNCSFSAETAFDLNDPVNVASEMLTDNDISVVFSAGNTGSSNNSLNPYSAAPWVVGVGATDDKSNLAAFSSRGAFGDDYRKTSLVAPGVNVVSLRSVATETGITGIVGDASVQRLTPGELPFYTTGSGTSFSAPQVAGAIALMTEANPNLHPAEIKDILQRSATPLPKYYQHEAGAGMLNTYAAVLEAAFPVRKSGLFRAVLSRKAVGFTTSTIKSFSGSVGAHGASETQAALPPNTVQATARIAWGGLTTINDLGLKIYSANGELRGESNRVNLPGLTGKRENLTLTNPFDQTWKISVVNSLGIGSTQTYFGSLDATRIEYADFSDVDALAPLDKSAAYESIGSFLMLPEGKGFRPDWKVSRADLAQAFVRGGLVPQYIAGRPMFADVSDLTTRAAAESVQSNPAGKLIFDAAANSNFRPNDAASRLVSAVAFVKAANLDNLTSGSSLPVGVADAAAVPVEWRGYVAVALQKGFIKLDNGCINPNRPLTRLELSKALIKLAR